MCEIDSLAAAASHPAVLVDATNPLVQVLQLMREGNRGGPGRQQPNAGRHLHGAHVLMKVAGQPTDFEHTAISQVMTVNPVTLPVEATSPLP